MGNLFSSDQERTPLKDPNTGAPNTYKPPPPNDVYTFKLKKLTFIGITGDLHDILQLDYFQYLSSKPAIVNTLNEDLQLANKNTGLSKVIEELCDRETLNRELSRNRLKTIKIGTIVMTSAGKSTKLGRVFNLVKPNFRQGGTYAELLDAYTRVINYAYLQEVGVLILPRICTGGSGTGTSWEQSTKALNEAIYPLAEGFTQREMTVILVIYPDQAEAWKQNIATDRSVFGIRA